MLIETSVISNGGSVYVRIPAAMVAHYNIQEMPVRCQIEDLNKKEARLIFG